MLFEIFREAWAALGRNPVRSLLTMTGIAWGIVAVTLLLSYGSGFRNVLMYTFEVFGKGAVICWPGTTSEQAGGERPGKAVRFEQEDADWVKAQSPLVKRVTHETVRWKGITHVERLAGTAIRGVDPEYGEIRSGCAEFRSGRHAVVPGRYCQPPALLAERQARHHHVRPRRVQAHLRRNHTRYRSAALFCWRTHAGHRRRRRDEYHAGLRRRTRPRNRPAPRARCEKISHSLAVLAGSAGHDAPGRRNRHAALGRHHCRDWHLALPRPPLPRPYRQSGHQAYALVRHHDALHRHPGCRRRD